MIILALAVPVVLVVGLKIREEIATARRGADRGEDGDVRDAE